MHELDAFRGPGGCKFHIFMFCHGSGTLKTPSRGNCFLIILKEFQQCVFHLWWHFLKYEETWYGGILNPLNPATHVTRIHPYTRAPTRPYTHTHPYAPIYLSIYVCRRGRPFPLRRTPEQNSSVNGFRHIRRQQYRPTTWAKHIPYRGQCLGRTLLGETGTLLGAYTYPTWSTCRHAAGRGGN